MFVINLLLAFLASFLFKDEGAGAAGGTDGDGGDGGKDKGEGAPPAGDPDAGTKTLTQDEVNRIVAERVRKEREKYSDYDVLKEKAEKHDAAEEAKKTEAQKEADARAAREREDAVKSAAADRRLITADIKSHAAGRVHNLDHVVALLIGSEEIKVKGDSVEGAKEALDALLKEHPYLEKKADPKKGASGGEFDGQDAKTLDQKIAEAEAKGDTRESTRLKLQKARATSA